MKKHFSFLTVLGILLTSMIFPGLLRAEGSQDSAAASPPTSKLNLAYLYCSPDSVLLTATLLINRDGMTLALKGAEIEFFVKEAAGNKTIGKAKTSQEGIAILTVPAAGLPADKDGMISYLATFAGNNTYPSAENSFTAKPASLKLLFSIVDSIKTLTVTATYKDSKGNVVPLAGETLNIYVPRLFSLLKIGEIALDETGNGSLEFPKEIVGDTLGNLTVLARLEEHDVYGFVQGKNVINWGVPKQYYKAEVPSRELWTPIAPMWMIITLIIMLLGVWAHYIYAVYELIMIKRISDENKPKLT